MEWRKNSRTNPEEATEVKKPGDRKQTKERQPDPESDDYTAQAEEDEDISQEGNDETPKEPPKRPRKKWNTPDGKMHYQCINCGRDVAVGPDDAVKCQHPDSGYRVVQKYRTYDGLVFFTLYSSCLSSFLEKNLLMRFSGCGHSKESQTYLAR